MKLLILLYLFMNQSNYWNHTGFTFEEFTKNGNRVPCKEEEDNEKNVDDIIFEIKKSNIYIINNKKIWTIQQSQSMKQQGLPIL
jgi:hypothetical protein